jgi:hypothetical protein
MRFIITESQLSNLMTEDNYYNVLSHFFDRVLKDFVVENDGEGYVRWYPPDSKSLSFHKNRWGNLWVESCGDWKRLTQYGRSFGVSKREINQVIIDYFNDKYSDKFTGGNLIQDIKDEHYC